MNPVEVWIQKQGQPNHEDPNEEISDDTVTMGNNDGDIQYGFDEDFREPSGSRQLSEPKKLNAQVVTRRFQELVETVTGDQERQDGHLTFRKSDLDQENIEFENGDRIVKIGDFEVDLMVEQVIPRAPLRGSFLLLQVDYKRNQSKRGSEQ